MATRSSFTSQSHTGWSGESGETLQFKHCSEPADYWGLHGGDIQWLGVEELTAWPTGEVYGLLRTLVRGGGDDLIRRVRCSTNPGGPGMNWVKRRFIDPLENGVVGKFLEKCPETGLDIANTRSHHFAALKDNKFLAENDPGYLSRILSGISDPALRKAWAYGSWDIPSGGMFDDVWVKEDHTCDPFPIPENWRIDRAYDHGTSKPFAVLWFARSNGEEVAQAPEKLRNLPPGSLFVVAEWYGSSGDEDRGIGLSDQAIAQGILDRESDMGIRGRVRPGPADNQIFSRTTMADSVADAMERVGVRWTTSDKSHGSRARGCSAIRRMLAETSQTIRGKGSGQPCLVIFNSCRNLMRTLPTLPRSPGDPETYDTTAEDHLADVLRYRIIQKTTEANFDSDARWW